MEYADILKKSIKEFMRGTTAAQTAALKEEGLKYTPEYFDQLEKDILGESKKKSKKDIKEAKDATDV